MSERLIVGNWKMHNNPHQASTLLHRLSEKVEAKKNTEVVICPPFIDLVPLAREIDGKKFKLGAQNINDNDEGAFTGEISAAMLKGLADYAIVGHSERRKYYGEDDKLIARKVAAAFRNGITPVLCVGESLHEREQGLSTKVVVSQLEADLAMIDAEDVAALVVAYEPVWAIGAGQPATVGQISPVVDAIRRTLEELYGEAEGSATRVIYGASVAPEFVKEIMTGANVDGLLPGGASLNYSEFAAIIKAVQELA